MNLSPLRNAVLLAAVAFLPFSAFAASSDDDFVLRFADAPAIPTAQSKAKPQKPRRPAAPTASVTADEAAWLKLIETVKKDGKYTPGQFIMPGSFSLEDVIGDPKGDHVKRSILFLGVLNDEDQFEAMGAMIASSSHKLGADGKWTIEHWAFETDVYGEVADFGHGTVVEDKDGKQLSATKDEAMKLADPKLKAQFDALVRHWAERAPKGE